MQIPWAQLVVHHVHLVLFYLGRGLLIWLIVNIVILESILPILPQLVAHHVHPVVFQAVALQHVLNVILANTLPMELAALPVLQVQCNLTPEGYHVPHVPRANMNRTL